MDFTFNYTLEKKDLVNFELFKLKTSKFLNMVYITVLIVLVMNTYYAVSEKIMHICLLWHFILSAWLCIHFMLQKSDLKKGLRGA